MNRIILLFCLTFMIIDANGQGSTDGDWYRGFRPSFEDKLQISGMTYILNNQYDFEEWNKYCCDDDSCPLHKLGLLSAKFTHKDGECQVFVNTAGTYRPVPGHPTSYSFDRIRYDFGYGGVLGSANEYDREDLRMMLTCYPQDSAKTIFNADYMLSYPFDMRRMKHENKYTRARCIVAGKNGKDTFFYFVLTNEGVKNFNMYLSDFQQTLMFENEYDFDSRFAAWREKYNKEMLRQNTLHPDTSRYHPNSIFILQPDISVEFKLPSEKDQSGVANILFKSKDSDQILQLDGIRNGTRYYNRLFPGNYSVIVLYNNGKYIIYPDFSFKKNSIIEIDMKNVPIHPSDSESQNWLSIRTFNTSIGERPSAWSDKNKNVRGYVFGEVDTNAALASILNNGELVKQSTYFDGYFAVEVDDNSTLEFRYLGHKTLKVDVKKNIWLVVLMEVNREMFEQVFTIGRTK